MFAAPPLSSSLCMCKSMLSQSISDGYTACLPCLSGDCMARYATACSIVQQKLDFSLQIHHALQCRSQCQDSMSVERLLSDMEQGSHLCERSEACPPANKQEGCHGKADNDECLVRHITAGCRAQEYSHLHHKTGPCYNATESIGTQSLHVSALQASRADCTLQVTTDA